jgi:hypothetical protein
MDSVRRLVEQRGAQSRLARVTGYDRRRISEIVAMRDEAPMDFVASVVAAGLLPPPLPPAAYLALGDAELLELARELRALGDAGEAQLAGVLAGVRAFLRTAKK